jgi:uncharacterized membrane protein YqaE (UPF0057 family)
MRARLCILFCFLLPPFALALSMQWRQLPLNLALTLLGWLPGVVHSMSVVIPWVEVNAPWALPTDDD